MAYFVLVSLTQFLHCIVPFIRTPDMTPLTEIQKPVATRSALPSDVICKGAWMPPYFNLLLVISSHLRPEPEIFVHITQRRDFGDTAVCPAVPSQNGSQASKMACMLGVLGLFSAGWCTILTRTENRTHPLKSVPKPGVFLRVWTGGICYLRILTCFRAK